MKVTITSVLHEWFKTNPNMNFKEAEIRWRKEQKGSPALKQATFDYAKGVWKDKIVLRPAVLPTASVTSPITEPVPTPAPIPVIAEKPVNIGDMFEKLEASLDYVLNIAVKTNDAKSATLARTMRRQVSSRILELQ